MSRCLCACQRITPGIVLMLYLLPVGCSGPPPASDSKSDVNEPMRESLQPLRILVVEDEPLGQVIQREWQARSAADVQVIHQAVDNVDSGIQESQPDVVIYPAGLLGELVQKNLIQPISHHLLDRPGIQHRDILPMDRGPTVTWGKAVFAFSLGSPQFVLFYRADLFEQLDLRPPSTWSQYQEAAARLHEPGWIRENHSNLKIQNPWTATVEPLGPGWAGQVLLVRAASYARRRNRFSTFFDYASMEPLIDRPPFVRALNELVEAARFGPDDTQELDPWQARQRFLAGQSAMVLTLPGGPLDDQITEEELLSSGVSITTVPGSIDAYSYIEDRWESRDVDAVEAVPLLGVSGRLGSVAKTSRQSGAALTMLANLSGPELSERIGPRSRHTTMFRESHLRGSSDWLDPAFTRDVADEYREVVQQSNQATLWLHSIRIPGRRRYLAALDAAVHDALRGIDSTEVLQEAAKQWREITNDLDRQLGQGSQRTAYRRSLGLDL